MKNVNVNWQEKDILLYYTSIFVTKGQILYLELNGEHILRY